MSIILSMLSALLDRLKRYDSDLKRKINRFESPIVRQLPPDIMSTIFEFCLPDFTDLQIGPDSDVDLSIPLSLGAICSYWREIAWSTPTLWSSLVIRVIRLRKHDPRIVTDIAHEWLSRSGQLPLTIRICATLYEHKGVTALIDIINQHSTRWSDLDLYTPHSYYQHFHATDNHAPILKSIRFTSFSTYRVMESLQLTCPRLERATLSFFPLDGTNIQWDNLTHLTLDSMLIDDSFLILRKTPRLVVCKVTGSSVGYRSSRLRTVVLNSLKSLEMTSFEGHFLYNLIAPHLEEFSLRDYNIRSIEAIAFFFRTSACSLRSFSMISSAFPPYFEGFMSLLHSMPSLNTLSIISITDAWGNARLTPFEDFDPRNILQLAANVLSSQSTSLQQGFLPNLKILEYTGKLNLRPEYCDDLQSLLPDDSAVHGPLHLIKINLTQHRLPKKIVSYLSSFVERGVTVNVMSESEDILQPSIGYIRRREDFFGQDWADNLESSFFS
jgi:F-box-like